MFHVKHVQVGRDWQVLHLPDLLYVGGFATLWSEYTTWCSVQENVISEFLVCTAFC